MSRARPTVPEGSRTIHLLSDSHVPVTSSVRLTRVLNDLTNGSVPVPAARVHCGDLSNEVGGTSESTGDTSSKNWMNSLPAAATGWVTVIGNHDTWSNTRDATTAATALAHPGTKNWVLDLAFCRVVGISHDTMPVNDSQIHLPHSTIDWAGTQAAGTSKDVVLVGHAPMSSTITDPGATGWPYIDSAAADFHVYGAGDADDSYLRAMINSHANIKVYCSGHVHPNPRKATIFGQANVGSRNVAFVGVPAVYYMMPATNAADLKLNAIYSVYLTRAPAGTWEARLRNHGLGVWDQATGLDRVKAL